MYIWWNYPLKYWREEAQRESDSFGTILDSLKSWLVTIVFVDVWNSYIIGEDGEDGEEAE